MYFAWTSQCFCAYKLSSVFTCTLCGCMLSHNILTLYKYNISSSLHPVNPVISLFKSVLRIFWGFWWENGTIDEYISIFSEQLEDFLIVSAVIIEAECSFLTLETAKICWGDHVIWLKAPRRVDSTLCRPNWHTSNESSENFVCTVEEKRHI